MHQADVEKYTLKILEKWLVKIAYAEPDNVTAEKQKEEEKNWWDRYDHNYFIHFFIRVVFLTQVGPNPGEGPASFLGWCGNMLN